jgi:hypothetical protein
VNTPGASSSAARWGAQDVEPVQGGSGVELVLFAAHGQAVVADHDGEVPARLVLADHLADLDADRSGAGQLAGPDAGDKGASSFYVAASRSSR